MMIADGLCAMNISTNGVRSEITSWRDFWGVAVAINGMCNRSGREDFQMNIGKHNRVHLTHSKKLTCHIGAEGSLQMEPRDNQKLQGTLSSS